jgi:large subunit ribosomal protein L9
MLGLSKVRVVLHPEVSITVTVNVARSQEEAEKQARGEAIGADAEEAAPADLATFLDPGAAPQPDV